MSSLLSKYCADVCASITRAHLLHANYMKYVGHKIRDRHASEHCDRLVTDLVSAHDAIKLKFGSVFRMVARKSVPCHDLECKSWKIVQKIPEKLPVVLVMMNTTYRPVWSKTIHGKAGLQSIRAQDWIIRFELNLQITQQNLYIKQNPNFT